MKPMTASSYYKYIDLMYMEKDMKRLLFLDGKNYDENMPVIRRIAVRGIISPDGKLLFVEDDHGVLKLPGGGQDEGEDDLQTLIREVREETGYEVVPESVRPFGYIEEKRRSLHEDMIWNQINRLYFCEVGGQQGSTDYSENEKSRGMHFRACTLEEALAINENMLRTEGRHEWNQREYQTLLLIKNEMKL